MIIGNAKLCILHRKGSAGMDTGREQIDLFLQRCDEVMQSKFILADSKISELLKSIAASDLLYAFFREITRDFDYPAAREKYMNYGYESSQKRRLLFPSDPSEKLAFIFCLLVDLDNMTIDLSDFLREYFYEDGSVYESYYAFCNQVIKPFKNDVKSIFRGGLPIEGVLPGSGKGNGGREEPGGNDLLRTVAAERDAVFASRLPDEKKVDALIILNALENCECKGDAVCGLLCGYSYFARAAGWNSAYLPAILAELKRRSEEL